MEMIMVLFTISITLLIVAPRWSSFLTYWDMETDVRKITAKVREVQQMAIRDNTDYRIIWDTGNERYTVEKNNSGSWSDCSVSNDPGCDEVELKTQNLNAFTTNFTGEMVTFDHFGGVGNCPNTECFVRLEIPGNQMSVYISSVTGRIRTGS